MGKEKQPFNKADLIFRYLTGDLSREEKKEVDLWLEKDEKNRTFLQQLHDEEFLAKEMDFYSSIDIDKSWRKFQSRSQPANKVRLLWEGSVMWKYAAVFVILVLSSLAVYHNFKQTKDAHDFMSSPLEPVQETIRPGADRATLTLADGRNVVLEEAQDGVLHAEEGVEILKQADQLVYQSSGRSDDSHDVAYNTITIPKGGQYQVVLPDGTKVWLNAASSLRFPTAFTGNQRLVELTGEGYFEVATIKHQPFTVVANSASVQVLGTHFNVNAYSLEDATRVSLLEGSVKVNAGNSSRMIRVGEQAVVDVSSNIDVIKADVEQVTAWKDGYFQFDNEKFEEIAQKLERWYDVEFVNPGSLANKKFAGAIPRDTSLPEVLKMLELSGSIDFEIQGRRIIVSSKL